MKSRMLLNLVLLAVLAVLGVIAYFEPGKVEPPKTPLTQVDIDKLDTFTLRQGEQTLSFSRKNGHWWLAAPFAAPANEFRVRQLLEIAKANSDASYPLKTDELAKFELDKPIATLVLGETTLIFGGSDPIEMRRYVRIGDTLHLVRDDFSHHLTAGPTEYVDKKLLPEDARIGELVLPAMKAKLGEDGKWIFDPPQEAGDSGIGELLHAWQSARAIDVKRPDKAAEGEKIRVGLANGEAVEFVVVQREPELLLYRPDLGLQYEIVGEPAKRLLSLPPKKGEEPKGEEQPSTSTGKGGPPTEEDEDDEPGGTESRGGEPKAGSPTEKENEEDSSEDEHDDEGSASP
ncbi:MAG TPA: DUF4340 domain-containing protein [Methylococcus sp.]|nr:DUF4340 domain-containing protein [Methylococcus sp.]